MHFQTKGHHKYYQNKVCTTRPYSVQRYRFNRQKNLITITFFTAIQLVTANSSLEVMWRPEVKEFM